MAPRTTRFVGPTDLGTSQALLYTVPSGRAALLRSLYVSDHGAGLPANFTLTLNGTSDDRAVWRQVTVAASGSTNLTVTLPLNAEDRIYGAASAANRLHITLGGYLYG